MSFFTSSDLSFEYIKEDSVTHEEFSKNENEAFDKSSRSEVYFMILDVCQARHIDELYGVKRMEVTIHVDLPDFAYSRKLSKEWLLKNFEY